MANAAAVFELPLTYHHSMRVWTIDPRTNRSPGGAAALSLGRQPKVQG